MEIVKVANEWAKSEISSSYFFMLFGLLYALLAFCCWQWGNTGLIKTLFIPILVAGGLLFSAGVGFYFSNNARLKSFEPSYQSNPAELIISEVNRTAQTIKTYENIALRVFPAIIIVAILISVIVPHNLTKAICISIIAFLSILVIMDSRALKRTKIYHEQLVLVASGKNINE